MNIKLKINKKFLFLILSFSPTVGMTQQQEKFDYPLLISCTPKTQIEANIVTGVETNLKYRVEIHDFEYMGNGRYRYKPKKDHLTVQFKSSITNKGNVLTLISPGIAYSIALYQDRYVGVSSRDEFTLAIIGAGTTIFEGPCEIKWR